MKKIEKYDKSEIATELIKCGGKRNKILTILNQIDDYHNQKYKNYQEYGFNQGKEAKIKEFREFIGIKTTNFDIHSIPTYIDITKEKYDTY